MFYGLFVIIACQVLGEGLIRATGAPLSSPVVGIALFFLWLLLRHRAGRSLEGEMKAADGLLAWLGLFFVPAGVGLMAHFDSLARNALPVIVTLIASTAITMGVTGLVFMWLLGKGRSK